MSTMAATVRPRRARRQFTDEFKAGAVRLVLDEGKTVGHFVVELQDTPGQRPHRDPGGGGGMVEVVIVGPSGRDDPQQLHPGQGTDLVADLVRGRHGMTAQKLECLGSGTHGPGPRQPQHAERFDAAILVLRRG